MLGIGGFCGSPRPPHVAGRRRRAAARVPACCVFQPYDIGPGQLGRMAGVEEALERTLNRPTHRWDPTEGIEVHEGTVDSGIVHENAGQLAVAIGLASRVQEM